MKHCLAVNSTFLGDHYASSFYPTIQMHFATSDLLVTPPTTSSPESRDEAISVTKLTTFRSGTPKKKKKKLQTSNK